MDEENKTMETTQETENDSEEKHGGIPCELIVGVIGVVGGGLLWLKKKISKKKYHVVDHGRFEFDNK